MRVFRTAFPLTCVLLRLSSALSPCPIDGPLFPKPTQLSESAQVNAAVENLTAAFKQRDLDNSSSEYAAQNYSYSIEIFSASESTPLFTWSHTASNLTALKGNSTTGVSTVDLSTVYRLGSLTKIFTVYNFLVNAGDAQWNEPITKFVPELSSNGSSGSDPVRRTAWDDVTIGSLATQMGGLPRDYALLGELLQTPETRDSVLELGFPPLSEAEKPPCGAYPLCDRQQFFAGIAEIHPSLAPFQSPAYSNIGYQLLGYALETITAQNFQTLLEDTILKPLNLTNTFYETPNDTLGVIPGDRSQTGWAFDLGESSAAGNMYSSAHDIALFGRAILAHTLLSPPITRRWLKPFAFSSDPKGLVGGTWGARRITLGPYQQITAFNKAGRIGDYSSLLVLIPDYDVGFSILAAGELPGNVNFGLADAVGEVLVPAIHAAAREEAGRRFGGRFVVKSGSDNGGLNSSITIATDSDGPGLSVTQWFSNSTDFRLVAVALQLGYVPTSPSIRLYPTGLETPSDTTEGSRSISFKAVPQDLDAPSREDAMFSTDCGIWVNVGSVIYGSVVVDEFIFHLDAQGNAGSVELPALRITLEKE